MNFSSTIQEGIRSLCHVQNFPLSTITYRTHTRHKSQTPSTRGNCFPIFGPNDSKKAVLPWVDSGYHANIQAVATALCVHYSWREISLDRPWQFWVSTCLDTATPRFCGLVRRKVVVISIQRGLDHMRPDNRIARAGPARQVRAVRWSGLFRETKLTGARQSAAGGACANSMQSASRPVLVLSLVLPLIFSSSPRGHGQTLLRRTPELT